MQLRVGIVLLGCGSVGESVAIRLWRNQDTLEIKSGVHYDLRAIGVRNANRERAACLRADLFSTNPRDIIDDPSVDIVIECIGGVTEASELVEYALDRGRHVVTANKDLLATQGPRLQALASSRGVSLRHEAAVGGAIPIMRSLGEGLAGDEVHAIAGVFNGTCTSILSAMEDGASYGEALDQAQNKGYAECDPRGDVSGLDTAHKLAVMIQGGFGMAVLSSRIRYSGITNITIHEIAKAKELGFRIRLVAGAVRTSAGVLADVAAVLVAEDHAFFKTTGADNVIRIVARDAGELELRGAGAGGDATASAVLGDLVSVLRGFGASRRQGRNAHLHALTPAFKVVPLFDALPSCHELSDISVWDDKLLHHSWRDYSRLSLTAAST